MTESRFLLIATFLLVALVTACVEEDVGPTAEDGLGCENVGEGTCFSGVRHLCDYENGVATWEAREDCGASATENCQCAVFNDGGTPFTACTVGGETSDGFAFCDGAVL